ncbi:MAG: hypothetical protein M3680_12595 [Myxococcota bacterium]|nr:hypothetical protein [Myxococcota bacterium]
MHDPHDTDRDFTRTMVALAVNDAQHPLTTPEIEQMADELLEWRYRLKHEFLRAKIADRIGKLPRAELEARLATGLAPTDCCTQRVSATGADLGTLSDGDLRERLVDAETFVERMAA